MLFLTLEPDICLFRKFRQNGIKCETNLCQDAIDVMFKEYLFFDFRVTLATKFFSQMDEHFLNAVKSYSRHLRTLKSPISWKSKKFPKTLLSSFSTEESKNLLHMKLKIFFYLKK